MATEVTREAYEGKAIIYNNVLNNLSPERTNSTRNSINFGSAYNNRVVAKEQGCHFTAPADKQVNEEILHPTFPNIDIVSSYKPTTIKFVVAVTLVEFEVTIFILS